MRGMYDISAQISSFALLKYNKMDTVKQVRLFSSSQNLPESSADNFCEKF